MLATITLLTSLIFAVIYPLCFWLSARDPLQNNFHHFHLGLPTIISAITTFWLPFLEIPSNIIYLSAAWSVLLFLATLKCWNKPTANLATVTVSTIIGLTVYTQIHFFMIPHSTLFMIFIEILSGIILCSSLYAMNLGHWYLNVHGLPIGHLKRAVYLFWIAVAVRLVWCFIGLLTQSVVYGGEPISLIVFFKTIDGILLSIGILFGILVPVVCLWFVHEILKLKNTQAATGILYVILCAVLVGDITFKYFLIKFGIIL